MVGPAARVVSRVVMPRAARIAHFSCHAAINPVMGTGKGSSPGITP